MRIMEIFTNSCGFKYINNISLMQLFSTNKCYNLSRRAKFLLYIKYYHQDTETILDFKKQV